MTGAHEPDPVLDALAGLSAPPPTAARDARIQTRCHAAMMRRGPREPRSWLRQPLSRPRVLRPAASGTTVDALLAAAAGLYGVVLAAEALKAALRF